MAWAGSGYISPKISRSPRALSMISENPDDLKNSKNLKPINSNTSKRNGISPRSSPKMPRAKPPTPTRRKAVAPLQHPVNVLLESSVTPKVHPKPHSSENASNRDTKSRQLPTSPRTIRNLFPKVPKSNTARTRNDNTKIYSPSPLQEERKSRVTQNFTATSRNFDPKTGVTNITKQLDQNHNSIPGKTTTIPYSDNSVSIVVHDSDCPPITDMDEDTDTSAGGNLDIKLSSAWQGETLDSANTPPNPPICEPCPGGQTYDILTCVSNNKEHNANVNNNNNDNLHVPSASLSNSEYSDEKGESFISGCDINNDDSDKDTIHLSESDCNFEHALSDNGASINGNDSLFKDGGDKPSGNIIGSNSVVRDISQNNSHSYCQDSVIEEGFNLNYDDDYNVGDSDEGIYARLTSTPVPVSNSTREGCDRVNIQPRSVSPQPWRDATKHLQRASTESDLNLPSTNSQSHPRPLRHNLSESDMSVGQGSQKSQNATSSVTSLDGDTLEWRKRVKRSVSLIRINQNVDKGLKRRVSSIHSSREGVNNNNDNDDSHKHGNPQENNSSYNSSSIIGYSSDSTQSNQERVRRISAIDQSDFRLLKVTATRLNLPTRRPSVLAWKEKYMKEGSPLCVVPGRSERIATKTSSGQRSEGEEGEDSEDGDGGNGDSRKYKWKLTEEDRKRINGTLAWLRQELISIRLQDQSLARQFLGLRHAMNDFRLKVDYEDHQDLIQEAEDDMEDFRELSQLVDLPPEVLSPLSPLRQVGITRMNISARRFSTC